MTEYALYLRAYTMSRVGQCIPDAGGTERNWIATALGVDDARNGNSPVNKACFTERPAAKLD